MATRKSAGTSSRSTQDKAPLSKTRFIYRGNASGAAGRIVRIDPASGLNHIVPVLAASSLPVSGGRAEGVTAGPYDLRISDPVPLILFSLESARTLAESPVESKPGLWTTHVRSEAHGLRILDSKIAVQELVADITSEHRFGKDFPHITPNDCRVVGLTLAGLPVEVVIDPRPFRSMPTKIQLEKRLGEDPNFGKCIGWRHAMPRSKGVAECHIIARVSFPGGLPEGVQYDPKCANRIAWSGVGTIFLGEFLISNFSRRLTLLRVALGSPIEGEFTAGEVETNGMTFP